jgi:hypothetical protein
MEEVEISKLTSEQEIERDIEKHPVFMAEFYGRKLTGSDNLTQTPQLEADRKQWQENKEKAENLVTK